VTIRNGTTFAVSNCEVHRAQVMHKMSAGSLARPVLVTFNGKSFDWPLLETRYRMSREISVPTPRAHLDFLHPARNLWRLRLGSVRLSELETSRPGLGSGS
jgi:uncharacterized protein YprB with RNaseH-like and TPR domain